MSRTARDRDEQLADAADRAAALPPASSARFLGRVIDGGRLPTDPERYYLVRPVTPGGFEAPGAAPAFADAPGVAVPVLVLGETPSVGDLLPCKGCGGRWVAENRGPARRTVPVPGCPCERVPARLAMTVNDPALNFGIFQDATLVYGPTPPEYLTLSVGVQAYVSAESFTTPLSPDVFRYWFSCYSGFYALGRLFARSALGSPYRDAFRFVWLIGRPGNRCSPFLLSAGQVFPGGDPATVLTIRAA